MASPWRALLLLLAILLAEGFYAVKLNGDFYSEHIPFQDSCSYNNQLAEIMTTARLAGPSAALSSALRGRNLALPWIEAIPLGSWLLPSRAIGVWLQWLWLAVLAVSLWRFFVRNRGLSPVQAIGFTLPFVAFESVFHWAGGLPDFRMDLSLYIFIALMGVWYLAATESESVLPWALAGAFGSLACLARATAPVYLAVIFVPLLVLGWRKARMRCYLAMALPFLPAIAYLIYNYDALHYYYVVWSPDANRHLSLRESWVHMVFGPAHIGLLLALVSALVFVNALLRTRERSFDWRPLYMGLAPCLLLTLQGAGLNPYVSMPAVFGCLMFAYFPFGSHTATAHAALPTALVLACLAIAVMAKVPKPLRGSNDTSMAGARTLVERMIADARARKLENAAYVSLASGDFQPCVIENLLIYEFGGSPGQGVRLPGGPAFEFAHELAFTATDSLLWKVNVPGATEEEKMRSLQTMADESAAYLLLPNEASITWLEAARGYNLINVKLRTLRQRWLASGHWSRLSEPVSVTPTEQIEIYKANIR